MHGARHYCGYCGTIKNWCIKMECLRRIIVQTKYFPHYYGMIRTYSVFPTGYKAPVFIPAEQEALKGTDEYKDLIYSKCKPAFISDTSSEFYDKLIRKFVNFVLKDGKKVLARNLVESALKEIKLTQLELYNNASSEEKQHIELDPKVIFHKAIENCKPILSLSRIAKGGIAYQVPSPISDKKALFYAMTWLIQVSKEKDGSKKFSEKLAKQLLYASQNTGRVVKKKQDLHKQCDANRAYAHFRWQ